MGPEPDGGPAGRAPDPRLDPLLEERFCRPLLCQLSDWHQQARRGERRLPLIGLNGPVGVGKSTLGRRLESLAPQFGLQLMVASIDDLYLSWPERGRRLADNPFGVSRVPPGSHDLPLLHAALADWRSGGPLRLPHFDKTLAQGQGDRCGWREQRCDALVLEGWLIGCRPLDDALLQGLIAAAAQRRQDPAGTARPDPLWGGPGAPQLRPEEMQWLPRWNRELADYLPLWQSLDSLWLLRPLHWGLPRRWRFQAEAQQRRRGGGWLNAESLNRLVRASLCSLPPALYQDPLLPRPAARVRLPAGQIACPALQPLTVHASDCAGDRKVLNPSSPQKKGPCVQGPPVGAVAWLDGRRRCRAAWVQASLSASSSATG